MHSFRPFRARSGIRRAPAIASIVSVGILLVLQLAVVPVSAAPSGGATAFVRVNQVGYPSSGSKRAYLMASTGESGATFEVRAGSSLVLAGSIGSDLGAWGSAYPHVYAIDFTEVTAPGTGRPQARVRAGSTRTSPDASRRPAADGPRAGTSSASRPRPRSWAHVASRSRSACSTSPS